MIAAGTVRVRNIRADGTEAETMDGVTVRMADNLAVYQILKTILKK